MNRIWPVVVSLLVVLGGGCQPSAPSNPASSAPPPPPVSLPTALPANSPVVQPLLRWHSLGLKVVAEGSEGTRMKEVLALPETTILKSNTLAKLSRTLPALLFPEAPASPEQAAKLKPLLEDILTYESQVIWTTQAPLRWRLAVKIPVERTGIWTANLYDLIVRGDFLNKIPRTNITDTTVVVGYSAAETYRYGLKDGWVTVERSEPEYAWQVVLDSSPKLEPNHWLSVELPAKSLPYASSVLAPDNLPYARLTIESKGENQTSRLSLKFPKALGLTPQPWLVPTNTIRDPVISFTAMQGIEGIWSRQAWLKPLGLSKAPQQAYAWSQSDIPYQFFMAFQATGASNLVQSSVARWTNEFNQAITNRFAGRLSSRTNSLGQMNALAWNGLPVIAPYLMAAPEPQDNYLEIGFFPQMPNSTNLPPELLQQFMSKPKVIYYDWEITEAKLTYWIGLYPMLAMSANRLPVANSPDPFKWLRAIAPKLGNTVTEAELAAPDEIKVLRRSPASLSGLELNLLARWLDQNGFPKWDQQASPSMSLPAIPAPPGVPAIPKKN